MTKIIYSLTMGGMIQHERWKGYTPISDQMRTLYDACAEAVDSGIFYNTDLRRYIDERFEFTGEGSDGGIDRVEGGNIGMEIYYARQRMEEDRRRAAEAAALARLAPTIGQELGTVDFNGIHDKRGRYRRTVIESVEGTTIKVQGTAGGRRYTITTTPIRLEKAIQRAKEAA